MPTGMDQKQSHVIEQVGIAERLLYTSAQILTLPQHAYEEYLSRQVEDNIFLELSNTSNPSRREESSSDTPLEESWLSKPRLSDVLLEQWHLLALDPALREAGELVVSNLNERGFHFMPLSALVSVNVPLCLLERASKMIAELEPMGCATSDWIESIWVQSVHRPLHAGWKAIGLDAFRQAMYEWESGSWQFTQEILDVESEEELRSYLARFTPYPGLGYDVNPVRYQDVDIRIVDADNGELEAILVGDLGVERLSESHYQAMLQQLERPQELAWLRQMWYEAGNVIAMHHYRSLQLLRVVNHIISIQASHLRSRSKPLRALQLKDIAATLEMSVSTVSRIIQHKYLWTEQGVILCKNLLSRRQEHAGIVYSRKEVKAKIQHLLYQYAHEKISDDKIRRLLTLDGIFLSRRTINKYRNEK